jgi:hypothetical protein
MESVVRLFGVLLDQVRSPIKTMHSPDESGTLLFA